MREYSRANITAAVNALVRGYEEETNLYLAMRRLTLSQKEMLAHGEDLSWVWDILDEKEDLLKMIEEIEGTMGEAKAVVLSQDPETCPNRWKLTPLLERLTEIIEELRVLETGNAALLRRMPQAG